MPTGAIVRFRDGSSLKLSDEQANDLAAGYGFEVATDPCPRCGAQRTQDHHNICPHCKWEEEGAI